VPLLIDSIGVEVRLIHTTSISKIAFNKSFKSMGELRMKFSKLGSLAGINLAALVAVLGAAPASAAEKKESTNWVLTKGAREEVCAAYAAALNKTTSKFPHCEREPMPPGAGFLPLNRVPLSADELYKVSEPLFGFAEQGRSDYYDQWRAVRSEFCAKAANANACKRIRAERELTENGGGRWGETYSRSYLLRTSGWKYAPELDIDNDGRSDPVILVRREPCGVEDDKGVFSKSPTYAFVMDQSYSSVDETRTMNIFGHPFSNWPKSIDGKRFRYIGDEIGIVAFRGRTYFDTFLTSASDFENRRMNDPSLAHTLAVFVSEKGRTREVCEIHWRGDSAQR
jgi:hypothetical protein